MPFVVTANCIVCKDFESNGKASEKANHSDATRHATEAAPRPPAHLNPTDAGQARAMKKPDADNSASG